ncbi:integrase [Novosphingobium sp. FSW06-99]|nr:integrase [Novosphingobium sp. FSW06-99]
MNCTGHGEALLPTAVADLVRDSLADNSRRAYASDLARFAAWGGTIPATDMVIAAYLTAHADTHAAATLARWLASLAKAHRASGHQDPTCSELVRSVLRGIRRRYGSAPDQAKPLLREDLMLALDAIGSGMKAARDRALLLIGFAGGFRRSELVALDFADIEHVRQGVVLTIRRSKTDQTANGRKIGVPYARGRHCPVASLDDWLALADITAGPVFHPVDRHGRIAPSRLSGEAVSLVVKERLAAIGIDPAHYSGHSLRAGFATSAVQAGASSWKVRQMTGHASDAMLARYVRDGELFIDNAAGATL